MKRAIVTMTDPKFVRGTVGVVYSARFYGYTGDIVAMYTEPLTKIDFDEKQFRYLKEKLSVKNVKLANVISIILPITVNGFCQQALKFQIVF